MIETFIQEEMLEEELNVIKKIISSTNLNIVDCLNRFVKENYNNDTHIEAACQLLKQTGTLIRKRIKDIEKIIHLT